MLKNMYFNTENNQRNLPTCTATADRFLCVSAEEGDVLSTLCCWENEPSVVQPEPEERGSKL